MTYVNGGPTAVVPPTTKTTTVAAPAAPAAPPAAPAESARGQGTDQEREVFMKDVMKAVHKHFTDAESTIRELTTEVARLKAPKEAPAKIDAAGDHKDVPPPEPQVVQGHKGSTGPVGAVGPTGPLDPTLGPSAFEKQESDLYAELIKLVDHQDATQLAALLAKQGVRALIELRSLFSTGNYLERLAKYVPQHALRKRFHTAFVKFYNFKEEIPEFWPKLHQKYECFDTATHLWRWVTVTMVTCTGITIHWDGFSNIWDEVIPRNAIHHRFYSLCPSAIIKKRAARHMKKGKNSDSEDDSDAEPVVDNEVDGQQSAQKDYTKALRVLEENTCTIFVLIVFVAILGCLGFCFTNYHVTEATKPLATQANLSQIQEQLKLLARPESIDAAKKEMLQEVAAFASQLAILRDELGQYVNQSKFEAATLKTTPTVPTVPTAPMTPSVPQESIDAQVMHNFFVRMAKATETTKA
jgi:hypothetical protein